MSIYEEVTGQPRPRLRLLPLVMAGIAEVTNFVHKHFLPNATQHFTPAGVRFLRMQRKADCSKAMRELGYRPTSIRESIQEAYECFVRRGVMAVPSKRFWVSRARES